MVKVDIHESAKSRIEDNQAWSCSGPSLFVYHGKKQDPSITLYDAYRHKHHTRVSQELAYKFPYASYGEWLLVMDEDITDKLDYCIVNVVTMQKFQLPPIYEDDYGFHSGSFFLLSGSPGSDAAACIVYLISSRNILSCEIGASEFTVQEFEDKVLSATIFGGRMFILTNSDVLYCAQVGDSSPLEFMECIDGLEFGDQVLFTGDFSKLVGSGDKLLYVMGRSLDMGVVDFEILEADLGGKTWKKVHGIGGDRAIFVDEFRAFSATVEPECDLQGNCIYYIPKQDWRLDDPDHATLFAYNLGNQRVRMLSPLPFKILGKIGWQHPHQRRWISCQ